MKLEIDTDAPTSQPLSQNFRTNKGKSKRPPPHTHTLKSRGIKISVQYISNVMVARARKTVYVDRNIKY